MADDDVLELIRSLRVESGPEEESFPLEGRDFNPVMKIASVLSRVKVRSSNRYYNNTTFNRSMEMGPPNREGFRRVRRRSRYSFLSENLDSYDDAPRQPRELYDASMFLLLESLGSGMDATGDRYCFMRTLQSSDPNTVVQRLCLMRVWQTTLQNYRTEIYRSGFKRMVKHNLEGLAHSIAMQYYEKKLIKLYQKCWGIPEGKIRQNGFQTEEFLEEYEMPDKGFEPVDPASVIAANVLYPHVACFEDRLKRLKSPFSLIQLVAGSVYLGLMRSADNKERTLALLSGSMDMPSSLDQAIMLYHKDTMERTDG